MKPTSLEEKQEMKLRQALEEVSKDDFLSKSQALVTKNEEEVFVVISGGSGILHSNTLVCLKAQFFFYRHCTNETYAKFKKMYPIFDSTEEVDETKNDEYGHLEKTFKVYLDYC